MCGEASRPPGAAASLWVATVASWMWRWGIASTVETISWAAAAAATLRLIPCPRRSLSC